MTVLDLEQDGLVLAKDESLLTEMEAEKYKDFNLMM
tara:strand:- start:570 stop:677 length:108 start_codon:yes stop_codon:yes gene_type:complete